MRKLGPVAVALAAVGFAGAAEASDLGVRGRSDPSLFSAAPMSSWTGFYVGLNTGGGWGTSSHSLTVSANGASAASGDFDVGGGLFGGTIGYSRQFGPWVFGGEADLDWVNIDGSKAFALAPAGIAINGSVLSRLEWLDTIRGRVGYTWGPTLVYLTGGAAYGAVTAQVPFSITAFGAGLTGFLGQTDTRLGWTIGVGLEQQILLPQLTGKLEYLYVDLGTNTQLIVDNVKFTTNILRVGGNWHF